MPAPLVSSRARLTIGDPDRAFCCLYCFDGNLAPTWAVNGQAYTPTLLPMVSQFYDQLSHGCYTLPANAKPGPITINVGTQTITLQAVAMPARKAFTIAPGTTALAVQSMIFTANGPVSLTLQPGVHTWEQMVKLPAGSYVSGYHATIRRLAMNNVGGNWPVFQCGQDCSIYGLTFAHDQPGQVFYSFPASDGLVAVDCKFGRFSNFGFGFTNSLVKNCTFDGSGAIIAPSGLFWWCHFNGPSYSDPWQFWGPGSAFMVDCDFNGTQRGPVFNAAGATISDCLFAGITVNNVHRGNNSDEIFLAEGGLIQRMTVFHSRVYGCTAGTFAFNGGADQIYVRDFAQDGGAGITLLPFPGKTITNFTLQDFELIRCGGIWCDVGVTGAQFIDGNVIAATPTRGNATWQNPSLAGYLRTVACYSASPTNTLTRVPVINPASCMAASQGFTVQP